MHPPLGVLPYNSRADLHFLFPFIPLFPLPLIFLSSVYLVLSVSRICVLLHQFLCILASLRRKPTFPLFLHSFPFTSFSVFSFPYLRELDFLKVPDASISLGSNMELKPQLTFFSFLIRSLFPPPLVLSHSHVWFPLILSHIFWGGLMHYSLCVLASLTRVFTYLFLLSFVTFCFLFCVFITYLRALGSSGELQRTSLLVF